MTEGIEILKPALYILAFFVGLPAVYLLARVIASAVFKSYFEAKAELLNLLNHKSKGEKNAPKV